MEEYNNFLDLHGIVLEPYVLKKIALERENALTALQLLHDARAPVLGGEIYLVKGGEIRLDTMSSSSWTYTHKEGQNWDEYMQKTWQKSHEIISHYQQENNTQVFFVLVPGRHGGS